MESIIGHQEVLSMLDRAVGRGVLAHAYLLVGAEGVGKDAVARWMAQRLLCQEWRSEVGSQLSEHAVVPCGSCTACMQVVRGAHPDCMVLRLVDGSIDVDAVRDWVHMLRCSSLLGGWKIGIVEEGATMTVSAANALLKLLEEPTPRTLLLVTARSIRGVLPTIASRCATIRLHRVPTTVIAEALMRRGVNDADACAAAAGGCPGRALQFAQDAAVHDADRARSAQAQECVGATMAQRLQRADRISREWAKAKERDLVQERADARACIAAMAAVARTYARQHPTREACRWCAAIARAPRYLAANVSPRLVLESMMVAAPSEPYGTENKRTENHAPSPRSFVLRSV